MPHLCLDPITTAAAAVLSLQTLVSRETSPYEAAVVSVTTFHAGEAYNVIPDHVDLSGVWGVCVGGS